MSTTTIRIRRATHAKLEELARAEGKPIGQLVDLLLAEHEKQQVFAGLAEDFQRLRADSGA